MYSNGFHSYSREKLSSHAISPLVSPVTNWVIESDAPLSTLVRCKLIDPSVVVTLTLANHLPPSRIWRKSPASMDLHKTGTSPSSPCSLHHSRTNLSASF